MISPFVMRVVSQDIDERLQYAQQLEKSGQLLEAMLIYEGLYQRYPNNETVFNQLRKMYLDRREYGKTIDLIETHQRIKPGDPGLEIYLAQVYFRMGEEEEAHKRWNQLVDRYPKQAYVYQMVANAMAEERLWDDAIDIYLLGRNRIGTDDLFVFDLANLYGAKIEYGKATEELIRYLTVNSQSGTLVESQILRYPKTERIINDIVKQFEKAIDADPSNLEFRRILVSVYLNASRYQEGFIATCELEMLTEQEKQGEALFRFGNEAFQSGEKETAEKAYIEILKYYPHFNAKEYVLFDLAHCYEAQNRFQEAIETYERIYQEYPKSPLARQVLYKKGLIQMTETIDLPGAVTTFRRIIEQNPSGSYSDEARLALGNCMVNQGDLDQAEKIIAGVFEKSWEKKGDLEISALVRLAGVHYLQGQFEEALSLLGNLAPGGIDVEFMQDPVLNDGLNLRLFVEEYFHQSPEPLILFARAEFFERQRKYSQAIIMLDSLIALYPDEPILADALFKKGEINIRTEAFHESLLSFNALLSRFPKSILSDHAVERMGWIYEKIGDKNKALEQYENLLVVYPYSFFSDEIRQRIRRIEGEN
ncbi:tetratricopeptide repeat protein [bacterium]|nr:tetratricopeptide repeat protein [bacterium]